MSQQDKIIEELRTKKQSALRRLNNATEVQWVDGTRSAFIEMLVEWVDKRFPGHTLEFLSVESLIDDAAEKIDRADAAKRQPAPDPQPSDLF